MTRPIRERDVRIGGVRIHTRTVGEGPPVLLVNGIGTHTAMWAAVEDALRGFRLIEFDAPGTGQSQTPPFPVSMPALAWMAARVLDAAGVETADVIGYSLGGIVSQQLAAQAPDRVRRLVLVAAGVGWGGVPGEPRAMLNVITPLRYWSQSFYSRTIGGLAGGRARTDADWVAGHGRVRMQAPPTTRGYLGQLWSAGTWSTLPQLRRIAAPSLVVTGDDDPLMPTANAMLLASRIPQARILCAPGEGHLLLMDHDSRVFAGIEEFLAAENHAETAVWRSTGAVTAADARAAIEAVRTQAQPWGAISAVVRWVYRAGGVAT